ncbi:MAG: chemotaxis protein CheB [Candidatus Marinimicrobia bacterium]|nr:chemotaxis protein CheB [Candidatus Neomarinimicrobiota bacterium]
MSTAYRLLSDPLLASISQILEKDSSIYWTPFVEKLGTELDLARKRKINPILNQVDDPVYTSICRAFQNEKLLLEWDRIIYLGCSAGGDLALRKLFSKIDFPHPPIIIAMHHNPGFVFLARITLANGVEERPLKVENDMSIKSNQIYFLPGDMIVGYSPSNTAFNLSPLQITQRFRPLIDNIFSIAGHRFGGQVVAAILTGMLDDGAQGLKDLYLNHGEVMIQDPNEADFSDMPKAAIKTAPQAKVVTIDGLAARINSLSRQHLAPKSFKSMFHSEAARA